jgi:hypothetical protein
MWTALLALAINWLKVTIWGGNHVNFAARAEGYVDTAANAVHPGGGGGGKDGRGGGGGGPADMV